MADQSEITRLKHALAQVERQIKKAKHRYEEAEHRYEEAEHRYEEAEHRYEEAEHRYEEERRLREEAEKETERTTLTEYITNCHHLLFTKFTVEQRESLTSKGTINNPTKKVCPTRLAPWEYFDDLRRDVLEEVLSTFPQGKKQFANRAGLREIGGCVARKKVADERCLEFVEHLSVEDPVRVIIDALTDESTTKTAFNIGSGVDFQNHPNALSDWAEETTERRRATRAQVRAQSAQAGSQSSASTKPDHIRPDQICVYLCDDDGTKAESSTHVKRRMAYVIEYKAPHKLTAAHLHAGLRPMNVYDEVVNRATVPAKGIDDTADFQYWAERLTAAAVTQTFHYMIKSGLEYGYLTTGEAFVFFNIDWNDPGTLYYHLAEPGLEVYNGSHPGDAIHHNAVGQVLAFTLLAFSSQTPSHAHTQDERERVCADLKKWVVDFEAMRLSIPRSQRKKPSPVPSLYQPSSSSNNGDESRSPRKLRSTCRPRDDPGSIRRQDPSSPEQSDKDGHGNDGSIDQSVVSIPNAPGPSKATGRQARRWRKGERTRTENDHVPCEQSPCHRETDEPGRSYQYCSLKCLLGLLGGKQLDAQCPNYLFHRRSPAEGSNPGNHPVDHATWLRLLRQQLKRTLDSGITPLGKQGARAAIFQITLLEYGYTFIGKGTVPEFVEDLEYEAAVYTERLQGLQGSCVPVCLGTVNLRELGRTYYYDFRVDIIFLVLLSWAGKSLVVAKGHRALLKKELVRSVRALHAKGVVHRDVRRPNIMWNDETKRPMIIDFERALLFVPPLPRQAPVVPNERAESGLNGDRKDAYFGEKDVSSRSDAPTSSCEGAASLQVAIQEDLLGVNMALSQYGSHF